MKKSLLALMLAMVLVLSACGGAPEPTTTAPTVTEPTVPSTTVVEETIRVPLQGQLSSMTGSSHLAAVMSADENGAGTLHAIDPETGGILGTQSFPDPYYDMQVFSDGVALWHWDQRLLQVFSDNLKPQWTRQIPETTSVTLFSDGFCYLFSEDGKITRLSLTDRTEESIQAPDGLSPVDVVLTMNGGSLIRCISADDSSSMNTFDYIWVDWKAGSLQTFTQNAEVNLARGRFWESQSGSDGTYFSRPETDEIFLVPSDFPWVMESTADRALLSDSDNALIFADFSTGSVSRLPSAMGYATAALCGERVVCAESYGASEVLLWNPAVSRSPEARVQTLSKASLAAENNRIAAEIFADTGMEIRTGEEALGYNQTVPTGYVSVPVSDPLVIRLALIELRRLTQEYPDGIFREMQPSENSPLICYLTGPIHGEEGFNYVATPSAFTMNAELEQVIVLDISGNYDPNRFRSTMAHELTHVMENQIFRVSQQRDLDYLSFFDSFLPSPELYFYSYTDQSGSEITDTEYTSWSDMPMEEVLFLDPYSRTMPTEDRARIIEHLYLGEQSEFAQQLQTGIMKQKAQYLCSVIRECFPSCQIDGRLPWETLDEIVPFSEYEEAVRSYEPIALG